MLPALIFHIFSLSSDVRILSILHSPFSILQVSNPHRKDSLGLTEINSTKALLLHAHKQESNSRSPTLESLNMNLSTTITSSGPLLPPPRSASSSRSCAAENVAIEGRNLSFWVSTRQGKTVPILKDCSLSIPLGQFWMLLGPNGCGKSTLLKILAGLLNPTRGNVVVKRPKSYVFQNPDHQVVMPTAEADVAFGLGKFNLTHNEVKLRVSKALDAVGMLSYQQRSVQTLSGGQKQRVAIAGALAEACKVLLLDELTTFLDESDQLGVIKAVRNSLDSSGDVTALWVTHRLEELEYADGAVYMEDGRVVMHGDAAGVLDFIKARQAAYIKQINS